jgi:gallate decarboxylase subunit C
MNAMSDIAKSTAPGKSVTDLRSALKLLQNTPGQLLVSDEPVDPFGELAGVYRYVGAGGTTVRPTKIGPAMLFTHIKQHPGARVVTGVFASRERVAMLLGTTSDRLGFLLSECTAKPIEPITVDKSKALCQQVVHLASEPGFDIRRLVPAPTNTPEDAGPYISMGLVYAADPDTGEVDVTVHRLCLQGPDEISMFLAMGRHIEMFRQKAEAAGKPLPITINIGLDPAIGVCACFEPPTTPVGFNELSIAGALRARPVELVDAITVPLKAIAHAEYVIEGELIPNVRVKEDQYSKTGKAMPEFPGYNGPANPSLPIVKVKAVTTRRNPIMQTVIGPSEEHVNLAGIPTEASILAMVENAMPGRLVNCYAPSSGGGKFMAILKFKKSIPADEGRQRQAAILAFAAYPELKHVILVDDDVDIFDLSDVMWALNTRYQGDVDTIFIPGVRCHQLDPSQDPSFSRTIRSRGISCKTIFDCTVPFDLKPAFQRAQFLDIPNLEAYLKPSEEPLEL